MGPDSAILSSLDSSFQNLEAQMAKAQYDLFFCYVSVFETV